MFIHTNFSLWSLAPSSCWISSTMSPQDGARVTPGPSTCTHTSCSRLISLLFMYSVQLQFYNYLNLRLHDDSCSCIYSSCLMLSGEQQCCPHAPLATATEAHLCFSGTTGASSMLHGALHQSLPEQLEAIRVIRGAASPLDDDKCQEKRNTPSGHFEVPFCCPAMFSQRQGEGQRGPLAQGGKLNGTVCCVCVCVSAHARAHFGQTWPKTTRIDILFEKKHNKTHRNTVQDEQGVILKVNKQKRRAAEVLIPLSSQRRGEVELCAGAPNVGFSNSSASVVFPPAVQPVDDVSLL